MLSNNKLSYKKMTVKTIRHHILRKNVIQNRHAFIHTMTRHINSPFPLAPAGQGQIIDDSPKYDDIYTQRPHQEIDMNWNGSNFAMPDGYNANYVIDDTNDIKDYETNSNAILLPGLTSTSNWKDDVTQITNSTIYMFEVEVVSSQYNFNGDASGIHPTLNAKVGDTLIFNVSVSSSHPFVISTTSSHPLQMVVGVENNRATSGTITWTPTTSGTYYYICANHLHMNGTIQIS
jgi:plastocyanin